MYVENSGLKAVSLRALDAFWGLKSQFHLIIIDFS